MVVPFARRFLSKTFSYWSLVSCRHLSYPGPPHGSNEPAPNSQTACGTVGLTRGMACSPRQVVGLEQLKPCGYRSQPGRSGAPVPLTNDVLWLPVVGTVMPSACAWSMSACMYAARLVSYSSFSIWYARTVPLPVVTWWRARIGSTWRSQSFAAAR